MFTYKFTNSTVIFCTVFVLLTNLSTSSLDFKSDQDLDNYIGFNTSFEFEGDDYKFLPDEWELQSVQSTDGNCIIALIYIGTDQSVYVIKSENSKNEKEIEPNDLVSWIMGFATNLEFPIKDFKDANNCKKFKDLSVEGLPAITRYLLKNSGMNEEQLKTFYKSLQLNFVKNDLENMSIKEAYALKEVMRHESWHEKFLPNLITKKKFTEISDKELKSVRKQFEKDFGTKALELKKKKSQYCENVLESKKEAIGIFTSLLNFFKGLFGSAKQTEEDSKFCEDLGFETISVDAQKYLDLFDIEGFTTYLLISLEHIYLLKSDLFKNTRLHYSEQIYPCLVENIDSANPTIKLYDAVSSSYKNMVVEADFSVKAKEFYDKDLKRYEELMEGINKSALAGYVASSSGETFEDKLVTNLKKDLKDLKDLKEAFDDFIFKKENEIYEEFCINISKILKELLLNSELNKKINFIDQDGIISQKVLMKFMAISGWLPNMDVSEESRNLNILNEKAVQILV